MFIHDIIKMKLVFEGYLPDYPYHMISDREMFEGFRSYFSDNYPCPCPHYNDDRHRDEDDCNMCGAYDNLVSSISSQIDMFLSGEITSLPSWVYSYMLGNTVGPNSDTLDIHDVISLLGADNIDDIFDEAAANACLSASIAWLNRSKTEGSNIDRPPTMFGEPHVYKYARLEHEKYNNI